jgi:hypothetical protein
MNASLCRRLFAVLLSTLAVTSAFAVGPNPSAERLCPASAPIPTDSDNPSLTEDDITAAAYQDSLKYLRVEFPKRLRELNSGHDADTTEGFWLSYFNSLTIVEGYGLKSAASAERSSHPGKAAGPAQARFCEWLQHQRLVD